MSDVIAEIEDDIREQRESIPRLQRQLLRLASAVVMPANEWPTYHERAEMGDCHGED